MTSLSEMDARKERTSGTCVDQSAMMTMETSTTGRKQTKLLYFLIGSGIGAAAGLLLAPKAGSQLRTDISEITGTAYDETVDLAHNVKEHSAELINVVKEKADRIYGVAAEKLSSTPDFMGENTLSEPNRVGDLLQLDDQMPSQRSNIRTKSSDIM